MRMQNMYNHQQTNIFKFHEFDHTYNDIVALDSACVPVTNTTYTIKQSVSVRIHKTTFTIGSNEREEKKQEEILKHWKPIGVQLQFSYSYDSGIA